MIILYAIIGLLVALFVICAVFFRLSPLQVVGCIIGTCIGVIFWLIKPVLFLCDKIRELGDKRPIISL
ncbi:hypothetical protein HYT26_00975 [Candidatus Pacearchaeota archaeon]|nr:hypothetical protein [Candidatus Pacearchaeota archaeon]